MDRLWTPWRYSYVTGADDATARKGVAAELTEWPGPDRNCVFCNLIASVRWGLEHGVAETEKAGLVVEQGANCFVCLNRFPYSSGHLMVVPYEHTDSLAKLPGHVAEELIATAQRAETTLRKVYKPDGINLGMNLGKAAGAGVAEHLHLHALPRWLGDTNFMTVTAETRILPETLETTWERLRMAFVGALDVETAK